MLLPSSEPEDVVSDLCVTDLAAQQSDLGGRIMISGCGNYKRQCIWLVQRDTIVFSCEGGSGAIHFAISYLLDNACAGIWRQCRIRAADELAA
jgi:hypothetical protein